MHMSSNVQSDRLHMKHTISKCTWYNLQYTIHSLTKDLNINVNKILIVLVLLLGESEIQIMLQSTTYKHFIKKLHYTLFNSHYLADHHGRYATSNDNYWPVFWLKIVKMVPLILHGHSPSRKNLTEWLRLISSFFSCALFGDGVLMAFLQIYRLRLILHKSGDSSDIKINSK